jgi:hypothetical protein
MNTNIKLKTAQAAEVAGVGYEGFRSWLKRGLLKETGLFAKFSSRNSPAEPADAKRWRWSAFGFADLCCFRIAKILLDAGVPWESMNSIVSDNALWQSHHNDHPGARYLAVFPKVPQYTLYSVETLAADLTAGIIRNDWMTLIDLREVRQDVLFRSRAALLKAIADDTSRTSHVFVRSGSAMLNPDKEEARRNKIEKLARKIGELATAAAEGAASYQGFEALLTRLHKEGKFPDNAAVSAVAAAFTEHHG